MPGQVEHAGLVGQSRRHERGLDIVERGERAIEPRALAHDTDVVPGVVLPEPLSQAVQVAGLLPEGVLRARHFGLQHGLVGCAMPPLTSIQRGMLSPAMPPNTVELATPLPPRRLAPCSAPPCP